MRGSGGLRFCRSGRSGFLRGPRGFGGLGGPRGLGGLRGPLLDRLVLEGVHLFPHFAACADGSDCPSHLGERGSVARGDVLAVSFVDLAGEARQGREDLEDELGVHGVKVGAGVKAERRDRRRGRGIRPGGGALFLVEARGFRGSYHIGQEGEYAGQRGERALACVHWKRVNEADCLLGGYRDFIVW